MYCPSTQSPERNVVAQGTKYAHYEPTTSARPEPNGEFLENTTKWIPRTPNLLEVNPPRLERPVVIPRIDISSRLQVPLPFVRAFSPDLRPYGVSENDFVEFIDNLAVAQAAPAPLKVLDAAGHIVGLVPHHWAILAGAGMNAAAGAGTAAASYSRTRYFMEKANCEYFAPRGLHVSVCKHDELAEKLGLDPDDAALLAKPDSKSGLTSVRHRRMRALEPYIASLSLDVPPPTEQRNILDKIAAKGIERKVQKAEKKNNSSSSSSSSDSSTYSGNAQGKIAERVRQIDRDARKDLKKHPTRAAEIEEKRARKVNEVESMSRNLGKKSRKNDKRLEKEIKEACKMDFIVVETLESAQ